MAHFLIRTIAVAAPLALAVATHPTEASARAAPTVVTATASDQKVVVGHSATVSGAVTPAVTGPRVVQLQLKTAQGWQQVGQTTTSDAGDYQMSVPTDWYDHHVLRAVAPATDLQAAGVSDPVTVAVVPAYDPRGKASAFKRYTPLARWDPCSTVPYRTNLRLAPAHGKRLVKQALSQVHAATGMVFRWAGSTTEVPFSSGYQGIDGGLVIAWSTPSKVSALAGATTGVGGASAHQIGDGPWQYVSGGVALDARQRPPVPGFGDGQSTGALLLHEIGHALGLDHVTSPTQIMNPVQQDSFRGRYEAGDLAGLHAIGAAQGCFG